MNRIGPATIAVAVIWAISVSRGPAARERPATRVREATAGQRSPSPERTGPARARAIRPAVAPAAFQWRLPRGLPTPRIPADNPMSDLKVALGRRLFYDRRLSGNGQFACATCHQQRRAFTDGRAQAIGSTGGRHARSTMSLTNVAYNASFGWADASLRALETQMAVPLFNRHPVEMGLEGRTGEVLARFADSADDVERFRAAFADEPAVSLEHVVKAIAAFERTLISGNSPLDRYLYRDDRSAMTPAALRGMALFFSDRLRCATCHTGFNLSGPVTFDGARGVDLVFHNTGLLDAGARARQPAVDRGLFEKTRKPEDAGRFRAPTLRNIAVTAPYMHDGRVPTLDAVLAHYASGGRPDANKSRLLRPFTLSAAESADLVAFLDSLTDKAFLTNPAFADPGATTASR
jgi:cytochrome c peroxidase